ncbi:MAG: triose-phosphate isomerase [Candidatus Niyogibacteria bacterium CG10_big_fil_rev_8_21_14_0_10_42_19]|uniref:Triosephosphate isomerase n=1 Tax=Candidatus Niyogibacteria bacterium CG10_big_fil_rev_8_21_14_0_10_42_19 TaxID=1974725 RepID=A0A2H0TG17_9BACT|nr:MAG: triose-phosphate isomerase [Candidatus Niyogibacteria bacterium CG10_big_fil_rev_8_21_14_0_10_42_19]
MTKKIIVANWKMNPPAVARAIYLSKEIDKGSSKIKNTEVIIAPPSCFLSDISRVLKRSKLGAQNAYSGKTGAYTGEISPLMLRSLGVKTVIVGHSERRYGFFENDDMVRRKMKAVLSVGLKAILCVGERERNEENFQTAVRKQIRENLKGIPKRFSKNIIIAYEPVWAIGTGKTVKPSDLYEMGIYIRRSVLDMLGHNAARTIPILYGGSVNAKNAANFIGVDGVDGFLVGGTSLRPKEFIAIVKIAGSI